MMAKEQWNYMAHLGGFELIVSAVECVLICVPEKWKEFVRWRKPQMCCFFSESRGLLLRLGRLIQGNLMWNLSCRSWPYLFLRHFEFAISPLTPLDGSSDSRAFDGRSKLWAKSWSMPPIGAPFVCSYFYSWHMCIFRSLWEPCWLWRWPFQKVSSYLRCSVKASQVAEIKTNWGGRGRKRRLGSIWKSAPLSPPPPLVLLLVSLSKDGDSVRLGL